ncbi:hypothetical protein [Isoptericola variabilis]|uniref:Uncharacterized protein n=1 Tax=Isoptericola variabilis (strain 225) TaxID=743718 RepID=F6FR96_ISOV2|nr:hypothetical protein [Isoptericola variabilis]AEG42956.1 hypothetical protein Isova_0145 [Isoptericola variabilis 225]TWH31792.1 hypothetical protein L600_002000000010 [Isoptericola variabilis J7]
MSEFIEWDALARVLVVGILVGAGIPALFALGLRLVVKPDGGTSAGADGGAPAAARTRPGIGRLVAAGLCFAVCVGAVITGIGFLVSGGH